MALLINGQPVAGLGRPGVGIKTIERTSGDGSAGTTDIYTITMTDDTTAQFSVYNGADGEDGSGGAGSGIHIGTDEPADTDVWIDIDDEDEDEGSGFVESFNGRDGDVMPQAGDYTAEMVGAAPVGYGLGDAAAFLDGADLDTARLNGWYRLSSTCTNVPTTSDGVGSCSGALLEVTSGGSSSYTREQIIHLGTAGQQGRKLRRFYHNATKVWSPWEWINPPMLEGKEYRTTERIGDKAVYKKLVNGVVQYRLDDETEWNLYCEVLGAPIPLSGSKTIYVATTGSDDAGDGSSSNPYATIQKALDVIPKELGNNKVTIQVAAGEYAGFKVAAFSGGYSSDPGIYIQGEKDGGTVIAGGASVQACSSYIRLRYLTFTGSTSSGYNLTCAACSSVHVFNCTFDGTAASYGVYVYSVNLFALYSCAVNNKTGTAVLIDGSFALVSYLSGENNTTGLAVGSSSSGLSALVISHSLTITANTQYTKNKGGTIIAGGAFL